MPEKPVNLLTFEASLTGQPMGLRKLGIAAAAVFAVVNGQGKRFQETMEQMKGAGLLELLGKEGAQKAHLIAQAIEEFRVALFKIYPTPAELGDGSAVSGAGDSSDADTGAAAASTAAANPAPAANAAAAAAESGGVKGGDEGASKPAESEPVEQAPAAAPSKKPRGK